MATLAGGMLGGGLTATKAAAGASSMGMGAILGAAVGGIIDNMLIMPAIAGERAQGFRALDLPLEIVGEGEPVVRCFGHENRVEGQRIWQSRPYDIRRSGNMKRGTPASQTWFCDLAIGFAANGISAFDELHADGEPIYQSNPNRTLDAAYGTTITFDFTDLAVEPTSPLAAVTVRRWRAVVRSTSSATDLTQFRVGAGVQIRVDVATPEYSVHYPDDNTNSSNWRKWPVLSTRQIDANTTEMVLDLKAGFRNTIDATALGRLPRGTDSQFYPFTWTIPSATNIRFESAPTQWKAGVLQSNNPQSGVDYEFQTGAGDQISALLDGLGVTGGNFRGWSFIVLKGFNLSAWGDRIPAITALVQHTTTPWGVASLIQTVLTAYGGGFQLSEMDTTALGVTAFRGFAMRGISTNRARLEPLMLAYNVKANEDAGQIKFFLGSGRDFITIASGDLGAHRSGGARNKPRPLQIEPLTEADLPRKIEVRFNDADKFMQDGAAGVSRDSLGPPGDAAVHRQLALPLTLTQAEGDAIANRLLRDLRARRDQVEHETHAGFLYVQPEDVSRLADTDKVYGHTWPTIVDQVDVAADFSTVRFSGYAMPVSNNAPEPSGADNPRVDPGYRDARFSPIPLHLEAIDVAPFFDERAGQTGYYVAVSPDGTPPRPVSGELWRKTAQDDSYRNLGALSVVAVMGFATYDGTDNKLASGMSPDVLDGTSSIEIELFDRSRSLSSATAAQLTQGANYAVIGEEVVQFRDVVPNGSGKFTLTNIMRGRYATDDKMDGHRNSERFVLLGHYEDAWPLHFVACDVSDIGDTHQLKAVPYATDESDVDPYPHTGARGATGVPLAPANVAAVDDGSGDIEITWSRRTRVRYDDIAPGPQIEADLRFEVDIDNGVRTTTVTDAEAFTYTSAMQTADALPGGVHTVTVRQLGDLANGPTRSAGFTT